MLNKGNTYGLEQLVLGTVQLGMPYGIANSSGQPDQGLASSILDKAYESGIRKLDTAAAYGSSERVIGLSHNHGWEIISKIPSLKEVEPANIGAEVKKSVYQSLDNLKRDKIHGILVHDFNDLTGGVGPFLVDSLIELKELGYVSVLGVSVYSPSNLQSIEGTLPLDIIQGPANIFDQRFIRSRVLQKLLENNTVFHARSVFLQGLLLMPPNMRSLMFLSWKNLFDKFDSEIKKLGLTPLEFCLAYIAQEKDVSNLIVGVEELEQLTEILQAFKNINGQKVDAKNLNCNDEGLIDPRQWGARV